MELDNLIRSLTGFTSFADLLNAKGSYRPSVNVTCPEYGARFTIIADAFDAEMETRGDDRRAYRY